MRAAAFVTAVQVPAIVYGGKRSPETVQIEHNHLWLASQNEWFYSSILHLSVDGKDAEGPAA